MWEWEPLRFHGPCLPVFFRDTHILARNNSVGNCGERSGDAILFAIKREQDPADACMPALGRRGTLPRQEVPATLAMVKSAGLRVTPVQKKSRPSGREGRPVSEISADAESVGDFFESFSPQRDYQFAGHDLIMCRLNQVPDILRDDIFEGVVR